MLTLFVAVVGDEVPFSVTIDASKTVHDLKKEIMREIECKGRAMDLHLYLAKTPDGTWLNSDDAKDVALDEDGNLQHYKMMKPNRFINRYFKATDIADDLIHVLVAVQDGEVGTVTGKRSNEELGEIVKTVHKVMRDSAEKVSVHSLSTITAQHTCRIFQQMALKVDSLEFDEPEETSIPGYKWIEKYSENQEDQRAQYMAYLETHLKTLLDKFYIANEKSILDTKDQRLPFLLKGTADIMLVRANAARHVPLAGLCLVIELKKKVENNHVNQTIAQLVCASIKSPVRCHPMSLLTDLNSVWLFTYFSDKNMLTHVVFHYPKNAIDFIKATIVDQPEGANPLCHTCLCLSRK
ncbi:hypothetical protein Ae201684P_014517 [Aphanomyces euteiches]|uniref:Crinkler effector protein N-terminal domain-containing protein n=1 Tax=Aphanomyces euteiches TaxID=100861 RepID=A0A6G0W4V7_9STRA|nr:hypothetical protein Ae201684_018740 [Aphanomyces euteiches]KAH9095447.1 hypothetical protein Ae201684P_014517 [Aphanomyces euteiches]